MFNILLVLLMGMPIFSAGIFGLLSLIDEKREDVWIKALVGCGFWCLIDIPIIGVLFILNG